MSLSVVKNRLLQSYIGLSSLHTVINQMVYSFNGVNVNNYRDLSSRATSISRLASDVKNRLGLMLDVNKAELPTYFSDFNIKTSRLISLVNKVIVDMQTVIREVQGLKALQATIKELKFKVNLQVWVDKQSGIANRLRELSKEIDPFKMGIDECNSKTRLGSNSNVG